MRVTGEDRVAAQRREARRGSFDAALGRAEARRQEARRDEDGQVARRSGERLTATGRAVAPGSPAVDGEGEATPPPGTGAVDGGAGDGAEVTAQGRGSAAAPAAAVVGASAEPGRRVAIAAAGEPGRAVLARAVRALPPVIEAFRASGQPGLSIDFGGAMGVELCQAPGGVEVRLAAPAALRPAARAELAGLCHALAARGVSVVSAEVRGGPPHRPRQR
jgi:hypothetical protein